MKRNQKNLIGDIRRTRRTKKRTRSARSFDDANSSQIKKQHPLRRSDSKKTPPRSVNALRKKGAGSILLNNNQGTKVKKRKKPSALAHNNQFLPSSLVAKYIPESIRNHWYWLQYPFKIIAVMLVVIIFYNARTYTDISFRPHYDFLTLPEKISAYKNPKAGQLGFDIIAIKDQTSVSVSAVGERNIEHTASGSLTVINDYSTEPQRLLPQTRFLSTGGRIFVSGDSEVIVPGKKDGSPGEIEIQVFATEPGDAYNIDATDFTIPGFKESGLDLKHEKMYAVSYGQFSGGAIETEKYVHPDEVNKVSADLDAELRSRLNERLIQQEKEGLRIISKSPVIEVSDIQQKADPEDTSRAMVYQEGTIFALILSNKNISNYIVETYSSQNAYPFSIQSLGDLNFSLVGGVFDFEQGTEINLITEGQPITSATVDTEQLADILGGVKFSDIENVSRSIDVIDRLHVQTRPFWKKRVTSNRDRINIYHE